MKKIVTLLALLPAMPMAFGQITLNATDCPLPTVAAELYSYTSGSITSPSAGSGATWDLSSYSTSSTTTLDYAVETNAFFTSAGCNRQLAPQQKHVNSALVYYYSPKFDFNSTGIYEKGIDIAEQLYDISAFSGGVADSFNVPAQHYLFTTPSIVREYPVTSGSHWSAVSRCAVDFNLTLAAAGLTNAPCQHVFYFHRADTVVGWGKMKVYTSSGPSMQYDVLMDKVTDYAVDSFYVGGSPAPPALLTAFSLSQGQQTDPSYRYVFLMKGTCLYLASYVFDADATFTTPSTLYMNKSELPSGINEVTGGVYSTVLFPNPVGGSGINLAISGNAPVAETYQVTDMLGRTIQSGAADLKQGVLHISFASQLAQGQYTLSVKAGSNTIATEQFTVTH